MPFPTCAARQQNPLSAEIPFDLLQGMLGGLPPPVGLNDLSRMFAPKGKQEDDCSRVARAPASARPLALNKSDVKILVGVQRDA